MHGANMKKKDRFVIKVILFTLLRAYRRSSKTALETGVSKPTRKEMGFGKRKIVICYKQRYSNTSDKLRIAGE